MQARHSILLTLFVATVASAQVSKPNEGAQPPSKEGVTTGQPRQPVQPPITSSGFVQSGPIPFEEITQKSGLATFHHRMGSPEKNYILDSVGSGVALLDYDQDGWLDIYLVNGSTYEAMAGKSPAPHAALFHNNHDGTFTDVAEKAGVQLGNWSTGATWGDYDGDGKLDLFVPGYVHYDLAHPPSQGTADTTYSFCTFRGVRVMCGPHGLQGEPDHLFRNRGDGTFEDVSLKAGVADKPAYYGLTSLFVDINNDGKPDLLVGNDSTPNYLYLNRGDGTFDDASYASGYALNGGGRETASMGIAAGDLTHTGRIDLFNTTFSDDYKPIYRNDGDGNFTDISYQSKTAEPTIPFLGWGTAFFDYDNDGWLDLLFVNGHIYPEADRENWGTSWKQRPLLFHSVAGKLEPVPPVENTPLAKLALARGLAIGDLFNDGRLDAVINNLDSTPSLFRNVAPNKNHWVSLKLTGGPKSPRDAIGTTVYLTAAGIRQRADVLSGGSFASTSDPRLHFGLGPATTIDKLEIHWPDGIIEAIPPPPIDTITPITEGKGTPTPK